MSMDTQNEDSGIGYTAFFSLKGGVGKTSLASAISLELRFINQPVPVITNDPISPLEELLGSENALLIQQDQEIPNTFSKEDDVIIDLGGFVDERGMELDWDVLLTNIYNAQNLISNTSDTRYYFTADDGVYQMNNDGSGVSQKINFTSDFIDIKVERYDLTDTTWGLLIHTDHFHMK